MSQARKEASQARYDSQQKSTTIENMEEQLRVVEFDKADLYQQILDISNKMTRELTAKHQEDSTKRDKEWSARLQKELNDMKQSFEKKSQTTWKEMEAQLILEQKKELLIQEAKSRERTRNLEQDLHDAKQSLELTDYHLKEKSRQMDDSIRSYESKIRALLTAHQMEGERMQQEAGAVRARLAEEKDEYHEKEVNRMESDFALRLTEQKQAQQKELDDLRSFHMLSNLAARKEADAVREKEIVKLDLEYQEVMKQFNEKNQKEISELALRMLSEKKQAVREAEERCGEIIKARDKTIAKWQTTVQDKEVGRSWWIENSHFGRTKYNRRKARPKSCVKRCRDTTPPLAIIRMRLSEFGT